MTISASISENNKIWLANKIQRWRKKTLPKVIIHNSISIDGSLTNFEPNLKLHYQIAGDHKPQAHLIGSNTIIAGVELYGGAVAREEEEDFRKPRRCSSLPYWVIPDTRGKLKGILHTCRRFELSRDIIILISKTTPQRYVEYLKERDYACHIVGENQVDLEKSLELLSSDYKVEKVLSDTGRVLGNLLVEQNLASELSLLVHPVIVGRKSYSIFGDLNKNPSSCSASKRPSPRVLFGLSTELFEKLQASGQCRIDTGFLCQFTQDIC